MDAAGPAGASPGKPSPTGASPGKPSPRETSTAEPSSCRTKAITRPSSTRADGAVLMIDEAHAFAVLGPGGGGAAWAEGIGAEPDVVRTITLSKALAAQGGAVLGAAEVIETLINTGRSFIFDTALAPPAAGAALAALHVLAARPEIARQAASNAS